MRDIRDLLATKGLSKIRTALDLLADHGYIEREETLKETYEKVIGVYSLDRKSKEMWEMIHRHEVASLFQMEQQSGIQGIYLTKPTTLEDLAALNSIIRLMASEPGAELPLEKYARYRQDPKAWDNEMDVYGLSEEEKALMHQMFDYSSGVAAQQEDLYQVILEPKIAGFSFGEADVLRKIVAKKQMDQVESYKDKIFKNAKEKGLSMNLVNYVWEQVIAPQVGYSFRY